jgi:hypothetical protein
MPDANHLGDRALKLLHVPPIIREPPTIKDVVQACHQAPSITYIRVPDMQLLLKGRRAAKDGKVCAPVNPGHRLAPPF